MIQLEAAKFLRFFSDMHQDFHINSKKFHPSQLWNPDPLDEDKDTILILAGDIWHAKKPFSFSNYSWFKDLSTRFKYILIVLGNHDFWNGSFPTEYSNFERYKEQHDITNLYLLQDSMITIGNHKFIGATLWTNYNNRDYETIAYYDRDPSQLSSNEMFSSDQKYIRYSHPLYKGTYKRIRPKQFMEAHSKSINYIFENAIKDNSEQTLWVISHHPPSKALINDPDLDDTTMGIVANDYDEKIAASEIDYWIHGHNHQSGSAKIGNTTIMANTLGYISSPDENARLNPDYNPWMQLPLN